MKKEIKAKISREIRLDKHIVNILLEIKVPITLDLQTYDYSSYLSKFNIVFKYNQQFNLYVL
jgi:hypothetical protein